MSTQQIIQPPSFDAESWRQRLAGLIDPDAHDDDDNPAAIEHKNQSVELCLCLCELFGDSLDRMTLWDRIGSALATACAKCDDGDIDRYVTLCLEHVKADVGAAGRNQGVAAMLYLASEKSASWRQGLVRYIAAHIYTIPVHARIRWEKVKIARKDERSLRKGGELSTGEIVEKKAGAL